MVNWVKVDDFVPEIAQEPWSMSWYEWKTGTTEFEDFLKNPLPILIQDFPEVKPDWRVITEIVNHEKGFLGMACCSSCIVMPDSKTVRLVLYKH